MGTRRKGKTPSYATGFFWQVNFFYYKSVVDECCNDLSLSLSLSLSLFLSLSQMLIVAIRSVTNLLRNPMASVIQVSPAKLLYLIVNFFIFLSLSG